MGPAQAGGFVVVLGFETVPLAVEQPQLAAGVLVEGRAFEYAVEGGRKLDGLEGGAE